MNAPVRPPRVSDVQARAMERSRAFDKLCAAWWLAKAQEAALPPDLTDEEWEAQFGLLNASSQAALFSIIQVRAPLYRHVCEKVKIVQALMDRSAGEFTDCRVEALICSIRVDLEEVPENEETVAALDREARR